MRGPGPPGRPGGGAAPSGSVPEASEPVGVVPEPSAELLAGGELLPPRVEAGLLLGQPTGPEPIDQHPGAILRGGGLVRPLDLDPRGSIRSLHPIRPRTTEGLRAREGGWRPKSPHLDDSVGRGRGAAPEGLSRCSSRRPRSRRPVPTGEIPVDTQGATRALHW